VIMTFDLNQYLGASLAGATLTGCGNRVDAWSNNDPITVGFYQYTDDGQVTLEDYNKSAAFLSNVQLPNNGFDNYLYFQIDVTDAVKGALDNSQRYLEFRAVSDKLTGYITAGEVPQSFIQDIGRSGPQLHLTMTPEPVSFLLFGAGLPLLFGARRLRKK
jgi:hypothetical protein